MNSSQFRLSSLSTLVIVLLAACGQQTVPQAPQSQGIATMSALAATPGAIAVWGWDNFGQISGRPTDAGYTTVASGNHHGLALKPDGSIVAWGWDAYGQVSQRPTGAGFIAISGGGFHSLALKSDGTIAAWGYNAHGEVSGRPTDAGYTAIAGGTYHNLALKQDGSIVAWGRDNYAQVSGRPTDAGYIAIAAGGFHSLALKPDGSIVGWGLDNNGQVSGRPTDAGYIAIAAGGDHSLALKQDGSIVAWGLDNFGYVSQRPTSKDFIAISVGAEHGLALKQDGSIVGWGWDTYGQASQHPTEAGYTAIAAGAYHSLALKPADNIAPTAAPTQSPGANGAGWSNGDVTVNWNWTDNAGGSGIDPANCPASATSSGEGNITLSATCKDKAGNTGSASVTLKVDKTAPTITLASRLPAPNANGWNNTDVTLTWNCADATSGVVSSSVIRVVSSQGSGQSASQTCIDNAGNTASNAQTGINIDKTAPTLAPTVSPNPVLRNLSATATPNAADGLSGIAIQSCPAVSTSSLGLQSVTCTATDRAGNTGTSPASYTVISASQALNTLTGEVQKLPGLGFVNRSLLLAQLNLARTYLNNEVKSGAITSLNTFLTLVNDIRGVSGGLTNTQANNLVAQTNLIIQAINAMP